MIGLKPAYKVGEKVLLRKGSQPTTHTVVEVLSVKTINKVWDLRRHTWMKLDHIYTVKGLFGAVTETSELNLSSLKKKVVKYAVMDSKTLEISYGQLEVDNSILKLFKSYEAYVAHFLSVPLELVEV